MLPIGSDFPGMFLGSGAVDQSEAVLAANGEPELIRLVVMGLGGKAADGSRDALTCQIIRVTRCRCFGPLAPIKIIGEIAKEPGIPTFDLEIQFKGNFQ